jgi:hypothetical protein
MHTFDHEPTGITIHHNGDYSGRAKISIPMELLDDGERTQPDHIYIEDGKLWLDDIIPASTLASFGWAAAVRYVTAEIENLPEPGSNVTW